MAYSTTSDVISISAEKGRYSARRPKSRSLFPTWPRALDPPNISTSNRTQPFSHLSSVIRYLITSSHISFPSSAIFISSPYVPLHSLLCSCANLCSSRHHQHTSHSSSHHTDASKQEKRIIRVPTWRRASAACNAITTTTQTS